MGLSRRFALIAGEKTQNSCGFFTLTAGLFHPRINNPRGLFAVGALEVKSRRVERARDRSGNPADFPAGKVEELKRIARFPAHEALVRMRRKCAQNTNFYVFIPARLFPL
jgi:hypothetical protein